MVSIEELKKEALINKIPICSDDSLNYILKLIDANNIKNILEIGTAIGYSSIFLSLKNSNITITTIEKDEKRYLEAIKNIKRFNLEDRIKPVFCDGLDYKIDSSYDLIFIDAAKAQNINFFKKFSPNLNNGGVIVTDNMLFHGLVEKKSENLSKNVLGLIRKIEEYKQFLNENEHYNTVFVDIGDGLAISYRK